MKSLYRKYRPLKLVDVVGQSQVITPLSNALKEGKISHAYLFTGPRGTGKTSVARIFAHEVNNFEYKLEDDYTDIIEIDGASNRGIDDIREIREKALIKPTSGKYKVYIIDEVHMLTKEAFNALLKTLEEPPEHVIFIMATTDLYKVPATILSRAQVYNFKLADFEVISKHLQKICEKEKIIIQPEALDIVVKRGGGSFRDSLSLLDQISTLSDKEITHEMVEAAMGLPEDIKIANLLKEYASSNSAQITALLKELFEMGIRAEIIAEELITAIIKEPRPEYLPLLDKLPDIKEPFAEARLVAAFFTNKSPAQPQLQPQVRPQVQPQLRPQPSFSNSEPKPQQTAKTKFEAFMAKRSKIMNEKKNPETSKISAIMGGEVEEYGGGNPF